MECLGVRIGPPVRCCEGSWEGGDFWAAISAVNTEGAGGGNLLNGLLGGNRGVVAVVLIELKMSLEETCLESVAEVLMEPKIFAVEEDFESNVLGAEVCANGFEMEDVLDVPPN